MPHVAANPWDVVAAHQNTEPRFAFMFVKLGRAEFANEQHVLHDVFVAEHIRFNLLTHQSTSNAVNQLINSRIAVATQMGFVLAQFCKSMPENVAHGM